MKFDTCTLVRPCTGESESGDAVVTREIPGGTLAVVIDVSGHGPEASELAHRLELIVMNWQTDRLTELLDHLHQTSRSTRGAAAGLAFFETAAGTMRYVGVGNTRIRKYGRETWRGNSRDGVLGTRMPSVQEVTITLQEGDVVAMYSDGLKERISQDDYPRLRLERPGTIANTLIERFGKTYDDASCIVIKCRA